MPNNGGGNTYSVVIDLPASDPAVTLDQNIAINGLTNSEVLHISAGATHLSTLLANTGAIDVTASNTAELSTLNSQLSTPPPRPLAASPRMAAASS